MGEGKIVNLPIVNISLVNNSSIGSLYLVDELRLGEKTLF